jgi:hypothetical protein
LVSRPGREKNNRRGCQSAEREKHQLRSLYGADRTAGIGIDHHIVDSHHHYNDNIIVDPHDDDDDAYYDDKPDFNRQAGVKGRKMWTALWHYLQGLAIWFLL